MHAVVQKGKMSVIIFYFLQINTTDFFFLLSVIDISTKIH